MTRTDWPSRPRGPLIWLHCPSHKGLISIAKIVDRLEEAGYEFTVLLTSETLPEPPPHPAFILQPQDCLANPRAFVRHWQPDILIWLGGPLSPTLLTALDPFETKRIFANATDREISQTPAGWFRTSRRALFRRFDLAIATDSDSAARLRRYGTPTANVENLGELDDPNAVPNSDERLQAKLTKSIQTRPIWLAHDPHPDELPAVIEAHKRASRSAHRLLLILTGSVDAKIELEKAGLQIACHPDANDITDATQVFITNDMNSPGTWLRMSPITFIGGSLSNICRVDPFEPASLGSAIIHGPQTSPYEQKFQRLQKANATRSISDEAGLADAVEALLAANINAEQAGHAWEVISEGAEAATRLEATLAKLLDQRSAA